VSVIRARAAVTSVLASFSRLGIPEITPGRAGRKTQSPHMHPPKTTEAAPSRRKRPWLCPWNWRFWILTLPVLFWTGLAILLFWPGLSFDWSAGERLSFCRGQKLTESYPGGLTGIESTIRGGGFTECAAFRCGPLAIERQAFDIAHDDDIRGFKSGSNPDASGFAYGWDTGAIYVLLWKR
jgi:hypothetical protein